MRKSRQFKAGHFYRLADDRSDPVECAVTCSMRHVQWGPTLEAQKTVDRLVDLLKAQPRLTQVGMAVALGVSRQAIQKHIASLKAAGRLRRIGPDKGGHWEVL